MAADDSIDLLRGHPNPSLLPIEAIRDAAQVVLSDRTIAVPGFLYGPDAGYEGLREQLALWLNTFYQPEFATKADRICISGGASQNLGCILGVYTDPKYTRNIWIVTPAYFLAFRIFEDAGFAGKCRAVPEDEEGLDIAYLEQELSKSEEKARSDGNDAPLYKPDRERAKVYKHIIYCVPTFANPSSRTMSLNRRKALVKLAKEYDALVISDDVYDWLQWPAKIRNQSISEEIHRAHLPRFVDIESAMPNGMEGFGNTCSNGSFSKIAGPGLRVGWAEGTEMFAYGLSQAGVQRSGGAPSQLTSTYVAQVLKTGQLQEHIKKILQPAYASRYAILMKAIDDFLVPLGFTLPQSDRKIVGGYFIWLGLPSKMSATILAKKCLEDEKVTIITGQMFEVPNDNGKINCPSNIRLCLAWEDENKLRTGVERIGRCARKLLQQ